MVRRVVVLAVLALGSFPGAAHGAEAWLPPEPVSPAGVDTSRWALDMDTDGDVAVASMRGGVVELAVRPAGGTFGAPVPVAEPGAGFSTAPDVAFGPGGEVHVVWTQAEGPIQRTWAAVRLPDGTITGRQIISPPGVYTDNPAVAVDRSGNAVAAWQQMGGLGTAHRPAGGSFDGPATLGVSGTGNNGFDLAFDGQGTALVVAARLGTGAGSTSYVEAAVRPPGGPWSAVQEVASAVDGAASPSVAFDAAGNALALYALWDPTVVDPQPNQYYRVHAAFRPAGGDFGPTEPVASTARWSLPGDVAFGPSGEAIATWFQGFQPQAAIRPPGGAFGPAQRLSPAVHDTLNGPSLRTDPAGRTVVVWGGQDPTGYAARAVTRPPGGAFSEMQTLSAPGIHANHQVLLAGDAQGNVAALWQRLDPAGDRIELAGHDAAPPVLRGATFPAGGAAGAPLPFSVDAVDVWSPVSVSWAFGDGTAGTGAATTHAYGAPGTYAAGVTATDALGNATSATGTVTVTPAPVVTPPDRIPPALTALRLSPARFRAASRGATLAAARVGTTVRFRLSEAATVRVTAQRATTGRRVGRACRPTTRQNRRRARCTRYVTLKGSATKRGAAGANRLTFRGRMNGRALRPGRYRLVLTPTDPARNRGAARRAAFRIVRR